MAEDKDFMEKINEFHKEQEEQEKQEKKDKKEKKKDKKKKKKNEDYDEEEEEYNDIEGYDEEDGEEHRHRTPAEGITEEFKNMLREYLDLEMEIKEFNGQLKETKQNKSMLEEAIKEHMKKFRIKVVNTGDAKIALYTSKTVKPLKKEDYVSLLSEKVGQDRAIELIEHIYSSRVYVESDKLRKTKR